MDLSRVKDDEKLRLCRIYFLVGFALLPLLWAINVVWFFRDAFVRRPEFFEQKTMKRYVLYSSAGVVAWLALLVGWQCVFQSYRVSWGTIGDRLSFTLPNGYA